MLPYSEELCLVEFKIRTMKELIGTQRKFFSILTEFFKRATGEEVTHFATSIDEFDKRIRRDAHNLAATAADALNWFYPEIISFYEHQKTTTFRQAKHIGGLKFVLGGSSRFTETHFNSVRKVLLYADTILIPDPILPWIESLRTEEQFRDVLLLRETYSILRLKPLVDANTAYPAVHIFQSWEKTLQNQDHQTIEGILGLTAGVLGSYLGHEFLSFDDLRDFIRNNPADYLSGIEQHNLFIAPGQEVVGIPLKRQISEYIDDIRQKRTKDYIQKVERLAPVDLVTTGIIERFTHQYHLMENAEELSANPMIAIPQQWHYFELCGRATERRLIERGVMSEESVRTIRALDAPSLSWLGDISIADLAQLREANENEAFRKELDNQISQLHGAAASDLNRVASQVSRAISSLIAKHKNEVVDIQRKYNRCHTQTAVTAWVTAAAAFSPILGPFVGTVAAPLAVFGKYAWDKYNEQQDLKHASKSLMGI